MPARPIVVHPDCRLRTPSAAVNEFGVELNNLVQDLVDTLNATATGIGISAPQIGALQQVLVMDLSPERDTPEIYINPQILSRSTPALVEESCLSVPGVVGNVIRDTELCVEAQDATGKRFKRDLSGMHAVCLQHEVDHLQGRLFIDRLSFFRRMLLRLKFRRA